MSVNQLRAPSGNHEGETVDATMSIEEVRQRVVFVRRKYIQMQRASSGLIHHPVFGEAFQLVAPALEFEEIERIPATEARHTD